MNSPKCGLGDAPQNDGGRRAEGPFGDGRFQVRSASGVNAGSTCCVASEILNASKRITDREGQRHFHGLVRREQVAVGVVLDADFRVEPVIAAEQRADAHEILEREPRARVLVVDHRLRDEGGAGERVIEVDVGRPRADAAAAAVDRPGEFPS